MVSTSFDPYNNTETITRETICNLEPVRLWAAIESELSFEKAKKLCDDLEGEFPVIEGPNRTDVKKIFSKFHAGIHCFIFSTVRYRIKIDLCICPWWKNFGEKTFPPETES